MKIRRLTIEDKLAASKVFTVCFHCRVDDLSNPEWTISEHDEAWGAFTEEGQLMSCLVNNHFNTYINGQVVMNGGIGGVCTLPEYRNLGCIREINKVLLPYEYERGEVISTLYPFDHSFYHKFGYDVVMNKNYYQLKPAFLRNYSFDGEVIQYEDGVSREEYYQLYEQFAKKYNFSCERSLETMKYHVKGKMYKNRVFSYLFKKDGKAISYIIFKDVHQDPNAFMEVQEMVFLDKVGLNAILGFLARFSADYGEIKFALPSNINLNNIIKGVCLYRIDSDQENDYMVRVINAKKVLELIKQNDFIDVNIQLIDDYISQNNKTFKLTKNQVLEVEEQADLIVSIPTFSQLVTGAISFEEAILKEDCDLINKKKMDEFTQIFVKKPIYISEHF